MPSSEAQIRCIKTAYQNAKLDFDKTAYVECHGTGTKVGDGRELRALSDAFCSQGPRKYPLFVGSIKPNIGHLEGSAGVAGLIKGVLIAEKGMVPPHLNFENWSTKTKVNVSYARFSRLFQPEQFLITILTANRSQKR